MIGSGILLLRQHGKRYWFCSLVVSYLVVTGLITAAAALSYGELAE
jgi:hypothetical protein